MSTRDFRTSSDLMDALYERYRRTMKRLAYAIVKDIHEAEDVVQLSMIRIMKNMEKIDDIDSDKCKHFILVITKNTALTEVGKRSRRRTVSAPPEELALLAGGVFDAPAFEEQHGFSEEIMLLLEELREQDKDILCLKYVDAYSDAEIGEILEIKESTVRKRLSRARKRLSEILEDRR